LIDHSSPKSHKIYQVAGTTIKTPYTEALVTETTDNGHLNNNTLDQIPPNLTKPSQISRNLTNSSQILTNLHESSKLLQNPNRTRQNAPNQPNFGSGKEFNKEMLHNQKWQQTREDEFIKRK
jgi:hypothetical protein